MSNLKNCVMEHLKFVFEGVEGIDSCLVVCAVYRP